MHDGWVLVATFMMGGLAGMGTMMAVDKIARDEARDRAASREAHPSHHGAGSILHRGNDGHVRVGTTLYDQAKEQR